MKLSTIKTTHASKQCSNCGGKCCAHMPGIFHPEQFKSETEIKNILCTGGYAIDRWEDDEPLYFLRPSVRGVSSIIDFSWGGACHFLDDNGCTLERDSRPIQCLSLQPREDERCYEPVSDIKFKLAQSWHKSKYNLLTLSKELLC